MRCESCEGTGKVFGFVDGPGVHRAGTMECLTCKGTGDDPRNQEWVARGKAMRDDRVRRGVTLSEAAHWYRISAPVRSDMEHGRIEPIEETITLRCLCCQNERAFPFYTLEARGVLNFFCNGECEDRYAARI